MFLILGFTKRTSYTLALYLLKNYDIPLIIADYNNTDEQNRLLKKISQYGQIINELGNQDINLLVQYKISKIYISPGVPRTISLIQEAIALDIEVLNDIEFYYQEFPNRQYIGITGTDGKTTVSTWLYDIIKRQKNTVLVGNVGIPIFEYSDKKYEEYIFIVELSSFQLESISRFHPFITIIMNLHEDHIDRYPSMNAYSTAKQKIFYNQESNDYFIMNNDDQRIYSLCDSIKSTIIEFSMKDKLLKNYYNNNFLYCNRKQFFDIRQLKVVGKHNIQNALIITIIAKLLLIKDEYIIQSLQEFQGISHRLQYIKTYNKIKFYNDSKATTVNALELALKAFDDPIILLAGGRSKNLDFSSLKELVQNNVKKVFYFGEMGQYLSEIWNDKDIILYPTMKQAFLSAYECAQSGDTILLSPGGTSFDEYDSYIKRGEHFINLVNSL